MSARRDEGFTLVETLIVSAILVLVVGASLQAVVKGLGSYAKIQEAFDRERNFGNFINQITYGPAAGVSGVMERNSAQVTTDGSTLTLGTVTYGTSGKNLVATGYVEPVLKGLDTSPGKGITFVKESDSGKAWLKVKAYMLGRTDPYIVYIAMRNEGALL